MSLNFATTDNAEIIPQIFIPLSYNSNFYSGLGYELQTTTKTQSAKNDPDLGDYKYADTSTTNHFWLNILSYEDKIDLFNYSIGAQVSYKNITLSEYGYLAKNTDQNGTTDAVPFSNDRAIEVYQAGIYADFGMDNILDMLSFRIGATLYPYTSLAVTHSLDIIGVVEDKVTSKINQALTYKFIADIYLKTGYTVDLSFSALYVNEPLSYDMIRTKTDGSFGAQKVDTNYQRLRFDPKLVFFSLRVASMDPMLGYGYENITSSIGKSETQSSNNLF